MLIYLLETTCHQWKYLLEVILEEFLVGRQCWQDTLSDGGRRKYLFFLCWKHLQQPHLLTSRLGLDLKEFLSGSIQKQKLWRKTCVTKESFLFQISDVFHKNVVYMLFKLVNKQLDGPGTRSDPQQKSHLCWGGRILTSHSPPVPLLSAKDVVLLKVSIF